MDPKKHTDEEIVASKQGPGAVLRVAREQKSFTQMDVANRLRLQTEIIKDIENDDYHRIRRHVFILGYLRAYAKIVGVTPEEVIGLFNKLQIPDAPSYFQAWQQKKPTAFMRSLYQRDRSHHPVRWVAYTFVLVLAVLSVVWWHTYKSTAEGLGVPGLSQVQHSDIIPNTESSVSTVENSEMENSSGSTASATTSSPVTLPPPSVTTPAVSPPSLGTPPTETAANLPIPPDEEVDFPATRTEASTDTASPNKNPAAATDASTTNNSNVNAAPAPPATPKKRFKSRRSQHANNSPTIPRPASAANTAPLPWNRPHPNE